jgi:hypothetical protein
VAKRPIPRRRRRRTVERMDETYRMLAREHEADLEREALKWRRAAEVRAGDHAQHPPWQPVLRASGAIRRAALRLPLIVATRRRTSTESTST